MSRDVIYFSSNANQIPLAGIGNLPYTDVIVAFLVPDVSWTPKMRQLAKVEPCP
jgi:hypothetical protein